MSKNKLIIFLISVILTLLITNIVFVNKFQFEKKDNIYQIECYKQRVDSLNKSIESVQLNKSIDSMNYIEERIKQKMIKSKPKQKKDISFYEGLKNLMLELNGSHK